MNWTEEQLAEFVRKGGRVAGSPPAPRTVHPPADVPRGRARGQHTRGKMNQVEADYAAEVLEPLRIAGLVARYIFEPVHLLLVPPIAATEASKRVPGVWYEPDFMVTMADGLIEMHEVKGTRGGKAFFEDDGRAKWKVAAQMFPEFGFRAVWRVDGEWREEVR